MLFETGQMCSTYTCIVCSCRDSDSFSHSDLCWRPLKVQYVMNKGTFKNCKQSTYYKVNILLCKLHYYL